MRLILPVRRTVLFGGTRLFSGLSGVCGLTSREDANPTMAPLAQSLVSRLSERWPPGGRQYTMVVEALVSLDAARVATRIATRVATVYTNAQNGSEGAISTVLCTLLRPCPGGEAHVARAVTPMPPGRCRNHPLTRAHEASVFSSHFLLSWDEKMR